MSAVALRDLPISRVLYDEVFHPTVPHAVQHPPRLRDQHSTGQCWLHAGVGLLETVSEGLTTRYPDVVHLYKRSLIRMVEWVHERLGDHGLDERTRHILLEKGIDDGATWGTFSWIASTYGVKTLPRPRRDWPYSAQNSHDLLSILRSQMRCGASVEHMTRTIEQCLPDANGPDVRIQTINLSSYFQIMNAPHHPLNEYYATYFDISGTDRAYNVSMDDLLSACKTMLESKRAVWATFCINHELDWQRLQAGGTRRTDILPPIPERDRKTRILQRDLRPDHAMLIVGYEKGIWRIHNSWGRPEKHAYTQASIVGGDDDDDERTDIHATNEWMRVHLFHAVVHEDVVIRPALNAVNKLSSWDALSTVARRSSHAAST